MSGKEKYFSLAFRKLTQLFHLPWLRICWEVQNFSLKFWSLSPVVRTDNGWVEEKTIWFIHVHRSNVKCRTQSKDPFSSCGILCIGERDMGAVGIYRGGVNGFPGSWMEPKKPRWSWTKVLLSRCLTLSWLSFSSVIRLYIFWLGKYQSENEKPP